MFQTTNQLSLYVRDGIANLVGLEYDNSPQKKGKLLNN